MQTRKLTFCWSGLARGNAEGSRFRLFAGASTRRADGSAARTESQQPHLARSRITCMLTPNTVCARRGKRQPTECRIVSPRNSGLCVWGSAARCRIGPPRRPESRSGFACTRSRCFGSERSTPPAQQLSRLRTRKSWRRGPTFSISFPRSGVPRPENADAIDVHSSPGRTLGCSQRDLRGLSERTDVTVHGNDVASDTLISQNGGR